MAIFKRLIKSLSKIFGFKSNPVKLKASRGKKKIRRSAKPTKSKKSKLSIASEVLAGEITHYFSKIQVGVVKMTKGEICVGEEIHIKGKKTDFVQRVGSLQMESVDIKKAKKGQLVGLKLIKEAQVGDKVFKIRK